MGMPSTCRTLRSIYAMGAAEETLRIVTTCSGSDRNRTTTFHCDLCSADCGSCRLAKASRGQLRACRAPLGGWSLASIYQTQSGLPYTISLPFDNANAGTVSLPNRACSGNLSSPTIQQWFNPSCFTAPAAYQFEGTRDVTSCVDQVRTPSISRFIATSASALNRARCKSGLKHLMP